MIVVRVELWSAITGKRTELARMKIGNVGKNGKRANYRGRVLRGRDTAALDKDTISREAEIRDFPFESYHVWYLVAKMLKAMNYL